MAEPTNTNPRDLRVAKIGQEFFLLLRDEPVLTTGGRRVVHDSPALLERMVEEFNDYPEVWVREGVIESPQFFCCYSLFCAQKDWVEKRAEPLSADFAAGLMRDATLYRCAGPEQVEQLGCWKPIRMFLGSHELVLPNLEGPAFDDPELYADEEEYEQAMLGSRPPEEFVSGVSEIYQSMSAAQRSVVTCLHFLHNGAVLFPITLAQGQCTPQQYTEGVLAANLLLEDIAPDVLSEDQREMYSTCEGVAVTALEYLDLE